MPDSEMILEGLSQLTNRFSWLGIVWHVLFYFMIAALILNWRPDNRLFGRLLGLPLLSVSLMAWISGNPFNGTIFALAGILMIVAASKNPETPVSTAHSWTTVFGIIIIAFGLVYPHFLETENYFNYLYMAPAGIIPCPTLSIVIGFAILFNGLESRIWPWIVIIAGLFYGIIGVFRLGVYLDMVLLLASAVLLIVVLQIRREHHRRVDRAVEKKAV